MKKNEHISADVERFGVISGELGQSVIVVEYLQIIEAHGRPTAAIKVHTAVARIDTEEAEVHETAEEEDGERQTNIPSGGSRKSSSTADKHR